MLIYKRLAYIDYRVFYLCRWVHEVAPDMTGMVVRPYLVNRALVAICVYTVCK